MLAICLDYCHSLLFWEGEDDVPSAYVKAVSDTQDDSFLTMLYNDEVHTYQQVTDALQVSTAQSDPFGDRFTAQKAPRASVP